MITTVSSPGSNIIGMPDDEATLAGADLLSDTELAESAITDTPLAYSEQTGSVPVADLEPSSRVRWWPVAVLVAVILAVTGGAAGMILWLGHNPERAPAAEPTAAAASAVTPGPLDGVYRFDRYDAQSVSRSLEGQVLGSSAEHNKVVTWWVAIRSRCDESGCSAEAIQLDDDLHQHVDASAAHRLLERNGQWKSDHPIVSHQQCAAGLVGTDTWHAAFSFVRLPDGTLKGEETDTVVSNECEVQGLVITAPVSATRTGDIPSTVTWNE